jgi:hypothetical protein
MNKLKRHDGQGEFASELELRSHLEIHLSTIVQTQDNANCFTRLTGRNQLFCRGHSASVLGVVEHQARVSEACRAYEQQAKVQTRMWIHMECHRTE